MSRKRVGNRHWSPLFDRVDKAQQLFNAGFSIRKIAYMLKVSKSWVWDNVRSRNPKKIGGENRRKK